MVIFKLKQNEGMVRAFHALGTTTILQEIPWLLVGLPFPPLLGCTCEDTSKTSKFMCLGGWRCHCRWFSIIVDPIRKISACCHHLGCWGCWPTDYDLINRTQRARIVIVIVERTFIQNPQFPRYGLSETILGRVILYLTLFATRNKWKNRIPRLILR